MKLLNILYFPTKNNHSYGDIQERLYLLRENGTNSAMQGGRGEEDPAMYGTCSKKS